MSEYSALVRTAGLQSVENVCSNDVDLQLTETHTLDIFIKHQVSVPPSHITIRCYCSDLQPSSIRRLATPWTYFLHLSLSSVILTDSSTESPVHVLILSIQAVRGLPRLLLFPYPHSPFHPFLLPIPPSHFMSFPSIFPTFSFPRITARGSEGALQLPQRVQAKPGRQA